MSNKIIATTLQELNTILNPKRNGYTMKVYASNQKKSIKEVLLPVDNINQYFQEVFISYPSIEQFDIRLFSERGLQHRKAINTQYTIKSKEVNNNQLALDMPQNNSNAVHGVVLPQSHHSAEAHILAFTKDRLNETLSENKDLKIKNQQLEKEVFDKERAAIKKEDEYLINLREASTAGEKSLNGIVDKVVSNDQLTGVLVQLAGKYLGNTTTPQAQIGAAPTEGKHQPIKTMVVDFIEQLSDDQAAKFNAHLIAIAPVINDLQGYTELINSEN